MTDSKFQSAFDNLMALEGGKTTDHAGPTNYGITLTSLRNTGDLAFDMDHDGDIDREDLWALSRENAQVYVYRYWYEPLGLWEILSPMVATKALDILYNCGPSRGTKIIQKAVNRFGAGLEENGRMDAKTLRAINRVNDASLVGALRDEQRRWYEFLVNGNPPKYGKYRAGWLRRART